MRKISLILCLLALLLLSTVEQTFCYLSHRTGETDNPFTAGEVTVTVTESFNGAVKSNVKITNTGTASAFVRVRAVPGWYNADGTMAAVPVAGTYSCSVGSGWDHIGSYYYYTSPVDSGESTSTLFSAVSPNSNLGSEYDGLLFHFDVLADSVQAEGTDDSTHESIVYEAWGVHFSS